MPFNIVVLVYLYKQGIPLPKNFAELYNHFICFTVCRHLTKYGHRLQSNITTLIDLPEPYSKILQQLTKLSLEALNDNKLIFTLDEIKKACPDITAAIPGAINGFGLLQAVEHNDLTKTTTTFNFLHFSIQEYLAAHYIANLPADEELEIIEAKFWSSILFNMFSMYIVITKGQRPSFKYSCAVETNRSPFLTNSSTINYRLADHQLKGARESNPRDARQDYWYVCPQQKQEMEGYK